MIDKLIKNETIKKKIIVMKEKKKDAENYQKEHSFDF